MQKVLSEVKISNSEKLFKRAQEFIPGGVNSPVRAFKAVGGTPRFIKSAAGAYLTDEDQQRYVDYVGSWGAMILGHAHPAVVTAVNAAAQRGLSYGAPCALEVELAEMIRRLIPSIAKIRFVNSGTEATMTAIRLARGVTGRNKIVKFEGCYHGHSDSLLVKAGSGALTFGVPNSAGVPPEATVHTLVATYNDLASVAKLFEQHGSDIAAIIVEPIAANMNLLLPAPGFLQGLKDLCQQYQSLLIFDEVITGFRVSLGGAQQLFNIQPDITALGKIIGGGMPVGAIGARAEIMDYLSPLGPVYQAGTLSGNPIAMAAGIANLKQLMKPHIYEKINASTQHLVKGLLERTKAFKIPCLINYSCGIFGLYFTREESISSHSQIQNCDTAFFNRVFHEFLNEGVYLAPSSYEAGFVSLAHEEQEIKATLLAAEKVFARVAKEVG